MLGMVSGMFRRLRLSQTADGQHTQYQYNRDEFKAGAIHQVTTRRDGLTYQFITQCREY
jgi:hypothetical protein